MASGWYNEPRRHALSAKGIKNAIDHKPIIIVGRTSTKEGVSREDVDAEQLRKGIKIEMEHTNDERIAEQIALDHLAEIPDYYDRLELMEEQAKFSKKLKDVDIKEELTNLAASIRHGTLEGTTTGKKLDALGVPMWKQNQVAYLAQEEPSLSVEQIVSKVMSEPDNRHKKRKPETSPPIPDTPSRFEPPPLGYDDWEQFEREYGHEVDEYGN